MGPEQGKGPTVQEMNVDDNPKIVVKQVREKKVFPTALLVLLVLSMLLVIVMISILIKLTKSKEISPNQTIYLPPLSTSDYQSNWYLQREEPVYQEPTHKNTLNDKSEESKIIDIYSVPLTSADSSTYSTPQEILPVFSNTNFSITSCHSTISSVATEWSSLEESAVDSSSSSSISRLPRVPSFETFNSYFNHNMFNYISDNEPKYSNVC